MKHCSFLILTVVGLALVSCQKEKCMDNAETVASEIELKSATNSSKSSIDGTAFPDGYGMLVSAYRNKETGASAAADDASADYFEDITFTKGTTSTWVAKTPKYWPFNGTLDFLCIASAGIADAANGVVPTCVWGDSDNVAKKVVATVPDNSAKFDDVLYGSVNAQTYMQNGNPITFNHAGCAVVFFAKSTVAYDADKNSGITVTGITVSNPKTSGVLTVTNPAAGASSGTMGAFWDLSSAAVTTALKARVWDANGNGIRTDEPALTRLDLLTAYSDEGANAASPTALNTKKFGDAYVILPPQDAVSFTINYTLHNGFKADGTTKLDTPLTYTYTPSNSEKWGMGKKVIYLINFNLHKIEIAPTITPWVNEFWTVEI